MKSWRWHLLLAFSLMTPKAFSEQNAPANQQDGLENNRLARTTGHEALAAYAEGSYERALELFTRAHALAHSPVFCLYQARAEMHLGRLLEARSRYDLCLQETTDSKQPSAWTRALENAAKERAELAQRIPRVTFEFAGEFSYPLTLTVNGQDESTLLGQETHELNPGSYLLCITDERGSRVEKLVTLKDGELDHTETFSFATIVAEDPNQKTRHNTASSTGDRRKTALNQGAFVSLMLGGTAAVLGGVTFGLALQKAGAVKKTCEDSVCPPSSQADADKARQWAHLSTTFFITSGVALGAGFTLWLLDRETHRTVRTSELGVQSLGLRAQPRGVELVGKF